MKVARLLPPQGKKGPLLGTHLGGGGGSSSGAESCYPGAGPGREASDLPERHPDTGHQVACGPQKCQAG